MKYIFLILLLAGCDSASIDLTYIRDEINKCHMFEKEYKEIGTEYKTKNIEAKLARCKEIGALK